MKKILARQLPPESTNFRQYFDDDFFSEASGDFLNEVYIVEHSHGDDYSIINNENYKAHIEAILDLWNNSDTPEDLKRTMADYGIAEEHCEEMRHYFNDEFRRYGIYGGLSFKEYEPESLAWYLSLKTGHKWEVEAFHGYSQGDYCEVVYCPERYSSEAIEEIGNFALGCGYEFTIDDCGGYFVRDEIVWEGGRKLVEKLADLYGCPPSNMEVEVITDTYTKTFHDYEHIVA